MPPLFWTHHPPPFYESHRDKIWQRKPCFKKQGGHDELPTQSMQIMRNTFPLQFHKLPYIIHLRCLVIWWPLKRTRKMPKRQTFPKNNLPPKAAIQQPQQLTWNPKQQLFNGRLVTSNRLPSKGLVHHPTETTIWKMGNFGHQLIHITPANLNNNQSINFGKSTGPPQKKGPDHVWAIYEINP